MTESTELRLAIAEVYRVFDKYHPRHLSRLHPRERSNFYEDDGGFPDEWRSLQTKELPQSALEKLSWKLLTTLGNENLLRWWLPRIIEIEVKTDDGGSLPQNVGVRLDMGDWQNWPSKEQAAIRNAFAAAWNSLLQVYPASRRAEDWLGCFEASKEPLAPYLSRWDDLLETCEAARLHFLDLCHTVLDYLPGGRAGCFWGDQKYELESFKHWFLTEKKLGVLRTSKAIKESVSGNQDYWDAYFQVFQELLRQQSLTNRTS